jgi:ribosomal protein L12E/L44/L45/RPP1/RPP2
MAKEMNLDFTNVKEGGEFNKKRQQAGDYRALVKKVADTKSNKDDSPMWLYTIEVGSGRYPYYCQFTEQTLWKIRNLLTAAGIKVPKKRVRVNPNMVVGKYIGVTLEDAEYEGKMQSEIASVFPTSELENANEPDEGDDEEDDEDTSTDSEEEEEDDDDEVEVDPEPKAKKKKKKKATAADVTDDELEELDIEDM